MTTLWAFIVLLGVLITIHEYGHFIAARSVAVQVERFSIGMPPRFLTIESIDNGYLGHASNVEFVKKLKKQYAWWRFCYVLFSFRNNKHILHDNFLQSNLDCIHHPVNYHLEMGALLQYQFSLNSSIQISKKLAYTTLNSNYVYESFLLHLGPIQKALILTKNVIQ